MSEFNIQSESIDVEQIMGRIRQRIAEKRDEDYTEEQIRELASVTLERFLDPQNVRSDLVGFYQRRLKEKQESLEATPTAPPSFEFDPEIVYRSSRGLSGRILYRIRKLLSPIVKFFFNPAPILHALTIQQQINERQAEVIRQMVRTQVEFIEIAALNYEVMNNLVVEMTRLSIEMKNHRMRVESVAGRLDFDERRARALEKVVQYRTESTTPGATSPGGGSDDASGEGTGSDRRRRRRRRGRRRPAGDGERTATGGATATESGERSATESGEQDASASGERDATGSEDRDTSASGERGAPAESAETLTAGPETSEGSASATSETTEAAEPTPPPTDDPAER